MYNMKVAPDRVSWEKLTRQYFPFSSGVELEGFKNLSVFQVFQMLQNSRVSYICVYQRINVSKNTRRIEKFFQQKSFQIEFHAKELTVGYLYNYV